MLVLFSFIIVLVAQCVRSEVPTIGGIFYSDVVDMKLSLSVSTENLNFSASIKEVSERGNILEISEHVCSLAKEGVIGIIDGTSGRASENIQAICDMLEIPHILVQNNDLHSSNWSMLNLYPSPEAYNMILESLIIQKEWNNFTILYVKGHSLLRVNELMKMGNDTDKYVVTVRELSGDDYRDVLIDAKKNGYTNFVVDCPSRYLEQLLSHAQQVGLMADEHSYIFLSPDLFTLDLNRYRYGGVNITGFRLADVVNNEQLSMFTDKFNTKSSEQMETEAESLEPEQMKTRVLLVNDAVEVLHYATKKVNVTPTQLDCKKYDPWKHGSSLLNFMKTNVVDGLTRSLIFNGLGQRIDVAFDVLEMTPAGSQKVGSWHNDELKMSRPFDPDAQIMEDSILQNKTLKVLIAMFQLTSLTDIVSNNMDVAAPYGYVKSSSTVMTGNDRYEGFAVDLIDKLSQILGFQYEFQVEANYGDNTTGKWNGMTALLMEEKADLAICDFTMIAQRQSVIDFSTPFMSLGIGILYKKPSKQPPEMFSFMAVFSKEVWYYMLLIQMALGLAMIFIGRISNKEWQNPVPCVEQPEELSNQFSFANSVWLIIGSVMQQGSEIAPIAFAPRMVTSIWWFFTMVMVASYVGTLVAFLTVEKNVLPFEKVEELASNKNSIQYGAKKGGSTWNFFASSNRDIYKKMFASMTSRKNGAVPTNDDGVRFAENSSYAFFMESTSIEYYTERNCDLIQIGGLLDSKSYGIGMTKNSPYKKHIDNALLKLKEKGEIDALKKLWWKERHGGGNCAEESDEGQKQLSMRNMLGAFVVLSVGCIIGLFISILDMLWGVFKRSVKYSTTFSYELVEELKFAIKFSGSVKPVKRHPKTLLNSASIEALAKEEGRDEVRSLRSLVSGKSTDTHRTSHSHSSRHSSRSLTVALARRREYY